MPGARKSIDKAGPSEFKRTEERRSGKFGRNVEEIQKFFSTLKLAKPKIDSFWKDGTPLRTKSKSPVDQSRAEGTPEKVERATRRKTIDSTYECKLIKERLMARRAGLPLTKNDDGVLAAIATSSTPNQNPSILVNGFENTAQRCQKDFRNLFSLLQDYIRSEADESKKEFMTMIIGKMDEKLSEIEDIISALQEHVKDKAEVQLVRRHSVQFKEENPLEQ